MFYIEMTIFSCRTFIVVPYKSVRYYLKVESSLKFQGRLGIVILLLRSVHRIQSLEPIRLYVKSQGPLKSPLN